MDKLKIKNDTKICYSILESTKRDFIEKIRNLESDKKSLIELRLDYLLCEGLDIDEIIELINIVKEKWTKKRLIATIRTVSEGGKVDLSKEVYFYYIQKLYFNADVQAIDVEYKYYVFDKDYYEGLFRKKKKDIILSIHVYDKIFIENEYEHIFEEMSKTSGNIIKYAQKVFTKDDLFTLMRVARRCGKVFKKYDKEVVIIAMGEIGRLSRIWYEFTNTKIVFLSAYSNNNSLGQFDKNNYDKYRKLLAKMDKNMYNNNIFKEKMK